MADDIAVSLTAEYARFTRGADAGAASLDKISHSAREGEKDVAGFFSRFKEGLAEGAGIEAFRAGIEGAVDFLREGADTVKEWIVGSIEMESQAIKTASAIGLSTQTLQGMQIGAQEAGIDAEELTRSMARLAAEIGKAAQDTAGDNPFKKLGLDARALASGGMESAVRQIADGLAAIQNPAQRAAAAAEFFGERAGVRLAGALGQGSGAIEEWIQKGKEAGTIVNDVDSSKLLAANQAMEQLERNAQGLHMQLALAVAPELIGIMQRIIDLHQPADQMREKFEGAFDAIITGVAESMDSLASLGVIGNSVSAVFDPILNGLRFIDEAVLVLADGLVRVAQAGALSQEVLTGGFIPVYRKARQETGELAGVIEGTIGNLNKSIEESHAAIAGESHYLADAKKSLAELKAHADEIASHRKDPASNPIADDAQQAIKDATEVGRIVAHIHEQLTAASGKPKELIDLENAHAGADVIAKAKHDLQQLAAIKLKIEMAQDAVKIIADLKKINDQHGLSETEKQRGKLIADHATPGQLSDFNYEAERKKFHDQLDQDNAAMKSALEEAMTPLEKYNQKLEELARARKEGVISDAQLTKLQAKAKADYLEKDSSQIKSALEEAMTPMDKYKQKLEEFDRARKEGLIDDAQLAKLKAKAKEDFDEKSKKDSPDLSKRAAAETRRFDMKIIRDSQPKDDPAKAALGKFDAMNRHLSVIAAAASKRPPTVTIPA